jgi:hypothetical protein
MEAAKAVRRNCILLLCRKPYKCHSERSEESVSFDFCHSKLDLESILSQKVVDLWIPAFAGMTIVRTRFFRMTLFTRFLRSIYCKLKVTETLNYGNESR